MISIISGTNRPNSNSNKVALHYQQLCKQKGEESQVLDLAKLPVDFAFSAAYGRKNYEFDIMVEQYVAAVERFVFIVPEYNGSFPGILKAFLDCVPPPLFQGKRAGLVGLSGGKAGNLRGMDHLTGILHYLKVEVLSAKPKLSQFSSLLDADSGEILDENTLTLLENHFNLFQKF
ncbi:MAG: NADPH-dependent FMN reductase [Luteibaculum sp.]